MNMAYRILVTDLINDAGLKLLKSVGDVEMDVIHGLSAAELCSLEPIIEVKQVNL